MPPHLLRSTPQQKTALWDAKPPFRLLGLVSTVPLVSLAVPLSGLLLLAILPHLCAVVRCYLLRRYIFVAVNCMLLLILKLRGNERDEETPDGGAPGEVSPDVWFDAALPPTFRDVTTENSESTPASTPKPADSSPSSSGSDESSCSTTGFKSPASPPVPTAAAGGIKPLGKAPAPSVEEVDDSMDATWKAIIGRPHLERSNTWAAPPLVQAEPVARVELRKSETAARRAVLERRIKGREVEVAWDHDDLNRRFDAFIEKFNGQLRLQRLASLRRRRYVDMVHSAGY